MNPPEAGRPRLLIVAGPNGAGNCAAVATLVDRLYLYDNSVDGQPAHLVLRASEGTVARQYEPARAWMGPILAELSAAS